MSKNTTLLQKLRYYFDNTLSSGSSAIIAWLAVVSVLMVILFGAVYSLTGLNQPDTEDVRAETDMDFYTLLMAAAERGETAIGYRLIAHKHEPAANFGICLNPAKAGRFTLAADDRVIVLANS